MHATFYCFEWDEKRVNDLWKQALTPDFINTLNTQVKELEAEAELFTTQRGYSYYTFVETRDKLATTKQLLDAVETAKEYDDEIELYLCDIIISRWASKSIFVDENGMVLESLLRVLFFQIIHRPLTDSLEDLQWEDWVAFFQGMNSEQFDTALHSAEFEYSDSVVSDPQYMENLKQTILSINAVAKTAKQNGASIRIYVDFSSGDIDLSCNMAQQRLSTIHQTIS